MSAVTLRLSRLLYTFVFVFTEYVLIKIMKEAYMLHDGLAHVKLSKAVF